jgi:hypothetical protein
MVTRPARDEEAHSTLSVLLRALGQALAEFASGGSVTRLTAPLAPTDTTVSVESTLELPDAGVVRVGSTVIRYTGSTATSLTGVTRPLGQYETHATGDKVTHDPHAFTD